MVYLIVRAQNNVMIPHYEPLIVIEDECDADEFVKIRTLLDKTSDYKYVPIGFQRKA